MEYDSHFCSSVNFQKLRMSNIESQSRARRVKELTTYPSSRPQGWITPGKESLSHRIINSLLWFLSLLLKGSRGRGCGKSSGQPGNVIFVLVPFDWRKFCLLLVQKLEQCNFFFFFKSFDFYQWKLPQTHLSGAVKPIGFDVNLSNDVMPLECAHKTKLLGGSLPFCQSWCHLKRHISANTAGTCRLQFPLWNSCHFFPLSSFEEKWTLIWIIFSAGCLKTRSN